MKALDINKDILYSYLELLNDLSIESKLELISMLTTSIKSTLEVEENTNISLFGAFDSDKSADQIITEIHDSRQFNRQTEAF